MLDLATITFASVHALAGSSRPGAVPPFAPIATTAAPTSFLPDHVSGAVAADAAVIELAGRVKALAHRDHRVWGRLSAIEDAVSEMLPPSPRRPEQPVRGQITETDADGVHTTTFSTPNARDAEHQAAMATYEAAVADLARQDAEVKARLGHPFWEKLSRRTFRRLVRWTEQLTDLEPLSQAGLAAKASALLAIQETGNLDRWVTNLAVAVSRDAVRIATALAAEGDPDAELLSLGRAWQESCARCETATEVLDAAIERRREISAEPPEALFWTENDHRRAKPYGSEHVPSGRRWFGEPASVEALRQGYPKELTDDRRREIIEAYESWVAENQAADRATGYRDARDADDEAGEENNALRRRILAMPARTMEGVLLKARVARWCFRDDDGEIVAHLADVAGASSASGETAAVSILLDLTRMLPDAPRVTAPNAAERSAA